MTYVVERRFESLCFPPSIDKRHVVYLLPTYKQRWWSPFKCSLVSTDTTQAVILLKVLGEERIWLNRRFAC